MKRVARVALLLLLMCGTLTTLVYIGLNEKREKANANAYSSPSDKVTQSDSFSSKKSKLVLSDTEFSLGVGESYKCSAALSGTKKADRIKWSSSDKNIASVDSSGNITAVSKGEAKITASISDDITCSVKVSVYENAKNSITKNIKELALNGSDDAYKELLSLSDLLQKSKGNAADYAAFLRALLDYGNAGAGESKDFDKLWSALDSALGKTDLDINQQRLRRAALSAYCHGEKASSEITISFTGDCTFGYFNETDKANMFPAVYRNSGSVTYPFDLTKNVFGADDITMINLECALTESTEHKDKQFFFRGEPSYVKILKNSSVEAVTVENNHSFDYLKNGFNDTLKFLKSSGIRYTSLTSPAALKKGDYRVVMLSLSLVSTTYRPEFKKRIEKYITQYKDESTVVIVNVHWGTEGADTPDDWQIQAAHSMIDAGADLIVGHHPHRLQGIEQYKGKYIAYSLGNFSFGGNSAVSYPHTIILRASFSHTDDGMMLDRISAVPCNITSTGTKVNNFQPTVLYGGSGSDTIAELLSLSANLEGGIKSINRCQVN